MADLVGDHIGLRELAGLATRVAPVESALKVPKERRIEIDLAIERAVERAHGGLSKSAARARDFGKHHQGRRLVLLAGFLKHFPPYHLGASEHGGYHLLGLVGRAFRIRLRLVGCILRLLLRAPSTGEDVPRADQHARIYAQPPSQKHKQDDGTDAESASAARNADSAPSPPNLAPPVFDVFASGQLIKTHLQVSFRARNA